MRPFLSIFAVVSFSLVGLAQSPLSVVPDTTLITGGADINELVAYSRLYNNGNDTIEVYWSRLNENLPTAWGNTAICDNNQCYLPPVSFSPDTVFIAPGSFSNFDVHFTPEDIPGEGTVVMRAWVIGDSASTAVTGFYKANAEEPTRVESKGIDNISIYPNPAKDYVLIKNLPVNEISTVEVFNIFGRKMLSFSQPPIVNESVAHKFDLSALAKGIYMIRVFDGDMNVIYTKSLSKE